jgi:hypothetical protein
MRTDPMPVRTLYIRRVGSTALGASRPARSKTRLKTRSNDSALSSAIPMHDRTPWMQPIITASNSDVRLLSYTRWRDKFNLKGSPMLSNEDRQKAGTLMSQLIMSSVSLLVIGADDPVTAIASVRDMLDNMPLHELHKNLEASPGERTKFLKGACREARIQARELHEILIQIEDEPKSAA